MHLTPGTRLGPYKILSQLRAGGMGEVYKACDSRLSSGVALKILPSDVAGDRSRRARFESEARSAIALNHHGIVAVYDIGQSDHALYIDTEVVDGDVPANAAVNDFRLRPDGKRFATTVRTPRHDILLIENFSLPSEHGWQRLNPFSRN